MASKRAGQVRVNLADWSGDAQVEDGANEQKHALTSKSISYDVAKVPPLRDSLCGSRALRTALARSS